jgi:hypothetical protein
MSAAGFRALFEAMGRKVALTIPIDSVTVL